jgi:hypothetical protein
MVSGKREDDAARRGEVGARLGAQLGQRRLLALRRELLRQAVEQDRRGRVFQRLLARGRVVLAGLGFLVVMLDQEFVADDLKGSFQPALEHRLKLGQDRELFDIECVIDDDVTDALLGSSPRAGDDEDAGAGAEPPLEPDLRVAGILRRELGDQCLFPGLLRRRCPGRFDGCGLDGYGLRRRRLELGLGDRRCCNLDLGGRLGRRGRFDFGCGIRAITAQQVLRDLALPPVFAGLFQSGEGEPALRGQLEEALPSCCRGCQQVAAVGMGLQGQLAVHDNRHRLDRRRLREPATDVLMKARPVAVDPRVRGAAPAELLEAAAAVAKRRGQLLLDRQSRRLVVLARPDRATLAGEVLGIETQQARAGDQLPARRAGSAQADALAVRLVMTTRPNSR